MEGDPLAVNEDDQRRGNPSSRPAAESSVDLEQLEAEVVARVGTGGFQAEDFELLRQMGQLSVALQANAQDPGGLCSTAVAVIAYAARLYPRSTLPLENGALTLLKEYLPAARAIGHNELLVVSQLCGLPSDKYQAALRDPSKTPPVVPLLGYFTSLATSEAASLSSRDSDGEEDAPSSSGRGGSASTSSAREAAAAAALGMTGLVGPCCVGSLWLVYKWEGLRPLSLYLEQGPPPQPQARFFQSREGALEEAWARRESMLRAIVSGVLSAVAFCHAAGVTHGSLCSGTVLLSTLNDAEHSALAVKVDNFGFGTWYGDVGDKRAAAPLAAALGRQHHSLQEGQHADLQAVGLLLAEALAVGMASEAGAAPPRDSLQRLLFEVFHEDVEDGFRTFCMQDDSVFGRMVDVLDSKDRAGWAFLDAAVRGTSSAQDLLQHSFLRV